MNNIMVDLETLGTRPGCIVMSIGAVEFDETGTGREFYVEISQDSSRLFGLHADPGTQSWWRKQSDEAKEVIWRTQDGGKKLPAALEQFSLWARDIAGMNNLFVYGDGALFDNLIMVECYRVCGIFPPWRFWNDRCYRTLKAIGQHIAVERSGLYHHALDDARVQAVHAAKILAWLRTVSQTTTPAT